MLRSLHPVAGFFFAFLLVACAAGAEAARSKLAPHPRLSDLALIRQRLAERYVATASEAAPESVDDLLARLSPDGAWPDLDYGDPARPEGVGLKCYPHTGRLRKLAGAFAQVPAGAHREALAAAMHRGLGFWLCRTPQTRHKWFMQIGAPTQLAQAAVLFESELSAAERAGLVRILRTALQPDGSLDYSGSPATGQNLIWEAGLMIISGCLTNDAEFAARFVQRAEAEMGVTPGEGIQHDASFHQHGPQFYSGGIYALNFADDTARWAAVLSGTALALAPATVETLIRQVLDGQRWMMRGGQFDYTTRGRHVAWPRNLSAGVVLPALAPICGELATLGGQRAGELRAFARHLRGEDAPDTGPVGTRVFWNSDYVVHARPSFFASARMSSRRVFGHESGTGQNLQGYHLGDGTFCLMVSGHEYDGIYPLWDWRRLPGVTCVYNPAVPLPLHTWGRGSEGGSDFAGGVDDGDLGAAAMQLDRGGAHARKAWFFLGDSVFCLGAELRANDSTLRLVTGVNQCWARGPVRVSGRDAVLPAGAALRQDGPGWVWHDGVAYLFPAGGDRRVQFEAKTAPWTVINTFPGAPKDVAQGDVFSLWLEHGSGLGQGTYAYVVVPGLEPAAIAAYERSSAPRILANTAALQAVAAGEVVQVVFWQPGALALPDGLRLAADQPCLVQLRRPQAGTAWTLAAGNPTQLVRTLNLTLEVPGSPVHATRFDFPAGPHAGRPLRKTFSRP